MFRHFTVENLIDIDRATKFEQLRSVAIDVLTKMPKPIVEVCGPITHGGKGSLGENMKEMERVISRLVAAGENVFNQLPFELPMQKIKNDPEYTGEDDLLELFYLPIFESGLIKSIYFMSQWKTSYGALWEHEQAQRLGIGIIYLGESW